MNKWLTYRHISMMKIHLQKSKRKEMENVHIEIKRNEKINIISLSIK